MESVEHPPVIECCSVTHRFADGSIGIEDINLRIHENEAVLFIGPNGSGKTTLFRHFIGLLVPQRGDVVVDGVSVRDNVRRARERIGMVFQDADCQIVGETVGGDVAFGPENLRLDRTEIDIRVSESLKAVGLEGFADRRPHTLSGGEKRRLAIAGILAMNPRVLVLDEPFANLDYPGMRSIVAILRQWRDAQRTLIVSSHQVEVLLPLITRVVLLNGGKIYADGLPVEVLPKAVELGILPPGAMP